MSEVEAAFRTIIRWTGENPDREGLAETPRRMVRAYEEYFKGYAEDPEVILSKTFEETEGYEEMIVLRGIRFESHCEHHMAPIIGRVGRLHSNGRVVGISKLARIVEIYAKRLQIQEKMTAQIANAIDSVLKPQGVGVVLKAEHFCMTARGIMKPGTDLVTSRMLGVFRDSAITPRVPQRNNPAAILAVSSSSTLESQADVDGHAVVRMPMHALMSASSAEQSFITLLV